MKQDSQSSSYKPIVTIKDVEDFRLQGDKTIRGDRRDGCFYRYSPRIKLAVNVAMATGRPLLVLGATGCGKSSLAHNLARIMNRRYYEYVVTSRSQARDLFYRFDAVRRLGDSHSGNLLKPAHCEEHANENFPWVTPFPYIEPGPIWWIFNSHAASRRGYPVDGELPYKEAIDPVYWQPDSCPPQCSSVLLIDEIDKAEPDFPNNLLVPLGSWQFTVEEVATQIHLSDNARKHDPMSHPLIVITSNRERELPITFLRRCIVLEIPSPTQEELVQLGISIFGRQDVESLLKIANQLAELRGTENLSIAEFLDSVIAIEKLAAKDSALSEILEHTTWRSTEV